MIDRAEPQAADGGAVNALSAHYTVDQGALCVRSGASGAAARDAAGAVSTLIAAAGAGLHVGSETASVLRSAANAADRLPAAERGAALVDLVTCDRPADAVDFAVRFGFMRALVPAVAALREMPKGRGLYKDVYQHTLRVLESAPNDPITRVAALLHDIAKPDTLVVQEGVAHFPNHDLLGADRAARRLRKLGFAADFVAAVETLVRLHLRVNSYDAEWTDSAVRRLHTDAGDQWQRLLDLSYADVTSGRADVVARARRRVQELAARARELDVPPDVSPLDGNALMARYGRGPGRWIGEVKRYLIELVREGTITANDEAAAWEAADRIVAEFTE